MSEGPVRHCPGCGQALRFPSNVGGVLMVNAEVVVEAAPGVEIVSVITKESAEAMGLKAGAKVKAMTKKQRRLSVL